MTLSSYTKNKTADCLHLLLSEDRSCSAKISIVFSYSVTIYNHGELLATTTANLCQTKERYKAQFREHPKLTKRMACKTY